MLKVLDTYDWEEAFYYAKFDREDVSTIIGIEEGENDGDEWIVYGKLTDGRYFFLQAGCDYTGWYCQAGGDSYESSTLEDVIKFGMDVGARKRFGLSLEHESA